MKKTFVKITAITSIASMLLTAGLISAEETKIEADSNSIIAENLTNDTKDNETMIQEHSDNANDNKSEDTDKDNQADTDKDLSLDNENKNQSGSVSLAKKEVITQHVKNDSTVRQIRGHFAYDHTDFSFKLTKDFEGKISANVGEIGEKVNAKVEHSFKGGKNWYVLTISGSKGEIGFWIYDELINFARELKLYESKKVRFISTQRVIDGEFVTVEEDKAEEKILAFFWEFKDETLQKVRLGCKNRYLLNESTGKYTADSEYSLKGYTEQTDVTYTVLKEVPTYGENNTDYNNNNNSSNDNNSDADTDSDTDSDLEETVVDKWKFTDKEGVHDYNILLTAEVSLNLDDKEGVPNWYKKLGKDVKAVIINGEKLENGIPRSGYSLIRFSGSKGNLWFRPVIIKNNEQNGKYVLTYTYESVKSFDGTELVRTNKLSETKAVMTFDENGCLEDIRFDIADTPTVVKESEIKYIGGGKMVYDYCQ